MTIQQLLSEISPLTHDQRMRRMVEVGRHSLEDAELAQLLQKLGQGAHFLRLLALQACYGSRDQQHILAGLDDPSRGLRRLALRVLSGVGQDDTVVQAFARLDKRRRQVLLGRLTSPLRRRCQETLVQEVIEVPAGDLWRQQVKRDPEKTAQELLEQVHDPKDVFVRLALNRVLDELVERAPDLALRLLGRLLEQGFQSIHLGWSELLKKRPQGTFDLLLPRIEGDHFSGLAEVAPQLRQDQLGQALERGWLRRPEGWLSRLAREQRAYCYETAGHAWRDQRGMLNLDLVGSLPQEQRLQEARRHLALESIQAQPDQRLPYAAYLPWAEAQQALQEYLGDPDPDLRKLSLATLIKVARYHKCQSEVIELLLQCKNEQDPVRLACLAQLAELPPKSWTPAHFKGLGRIIRDAWEAGDVSHASMTAVERLLLRLLPLQPQWSAPWLVKLWTERGQLHSYSLVTSVFGEGQRALAAELPPLLEEWRKREHFPAILQLARALDYRLAGFPDLVSELVRICDDPRGQEAAPAFDILNTQRSGVIPELVPRLLVQDASWVLRVGFCEYLHRHRQDLLTPYLSQSQPLTGKFASGEVFSVLPLEDHFYRWTPEQQFSYASVLEKVLADRNRPAPSWKMAISRLSRLPALQPKQLLQLASPQEDRPQVQEWALRALARLDAGQGTQGLLAALQDERARIAIYALRQCLMPMPAGRALEILRSAPLARVTVAKEVLRLLGDLPDQAGLEYLLEIAPTLTHRDVRVAHLRSLWDHLREERCWAFFEAAAEDPEPAVVASLGQFPAGNYPPSIRSRWGALLVRALGHPSPRARLAILASLDRFPDPDQLFLAPLTTALQSKESSESAAAAAALVRLYYDRSEVLAELVRTVLPQRRALKTLSDQLALYSRLVAPGFLQVLQDDPHTLPLRLRLAARALPLTDFLSCIESELGADSWAWDVHESVVECIPRTDQRLLINTLTTVLERWRNSTDPRMRRLALEWLLKTAQRHGWTPELRQHLADFQADPAAFVAGPAQFTFPPELCSPTVAAVQAEISRRE